VVARELHSRREIRLFRDELVKLTSPPFDIGPDACFVSYGVAAEGSCFAVLGWGAPYNTVCLYAENLLRLNGQPRRQGDTSLLAAMAHHGLPAMTAAHKEAMRSKIMQQSEWSREEQEEILDYCRQDVIAAEQLLLAMERCGDIDWPRALWRGAFMFGTAIIENEGIPVDDGLYFRLRKHWDAIRLRLIERIDRDYGIYVGGHFNRRLFAAWLVAHEIPWPRLRSGNLALDQETFKAMTKAYPVLAPLRELMVTLDQMRSTNLTIGADHRNRCWSRPLLSRTGRNQPSTSANILGSAAWLRGLITPPSGHALIAIDWVAQEIAIAAGQSRDEKLCAAYASNDIHMATAIATGLAPEGATRETHPAERERIKPVSLGTAYGISASGVAEAIGVSRAEGRMILEAHRHAYPKFWQWLQRIVDNAMLQGEMAAPMGWRMAITGEPNPRTLMNWRMQATGAEMMRAAVVKMLRIGLRPCATAHDSVMILSPLDQMKTAAAQAQEIMERTSLSFTNGLRVRTTVRELLPSQRFLEKRGERMWLLIMKLLTEVEGFRKDGSMGPMGLMGTMPCLLDGRKKEEERKKKKERRKKEREKEEFLRTTRPIAAIRPMRPIKPIGHEGGCDEWSPLLPARLPRSRDPGGHH
jgi:hypothetical protein